MVDDTMEVFMDDFSIVGYLVESCLEPLGKVLELCIEINLILNWKNSSFMVKENIILEQNISR